MADPIVPNIGRVYFLKSGLQRDPSGLASFHPASSSDVNKLEVFLEDGVSTNVVMVNYKADNKGYPTAEFFPMKYVETVNHMVSGEDFYRTFARFEGFMPPQVSQWNANGNAPMSIATTVVQTAGDSLIASVQNVSALELAYPATEELYDDNAVAYCYETEGENIYGYYMVSYDGGEDTYSWERIDNPVNQINGVSVKQYNVLGVTLQKGNLPTVSQPVSITQEYIRYILAYMAEVNDKAITAQSEIDALEIIVDNILNGIEPIYYDNTISGLTAEDLKSAIDEIVAKYESMHSDVDSLKDGTHEFSQIILTDGTNQAVAIYDGKNIVWQYRGIYAEMFENLFVEVRANGNITNGDVVQYDSAIGASGNIRAKKAVPSEINANPRLILGVATEDILSGQDGVINFFGEVNDIDTTSYSGIAGTPLYFDSGSASNGLMTSTKPVAPNVQVEMGLLTVKHATQGQVKILVNFGNSLKDLHDVHFNTHVFQGGEVIKYVIAENRWEVYDLDGKLLEIDTELARLEQDKADITYVDDENDAQDLRLDDLENANMIKSVTRSGSNLFTITYYDDTTSSLLTLSELKAFIGEATQSLSGLMSAQDKTDLDTLMALFDEDGDSVVNTIAEVLSIFNNYPEGADLVTALDGKVDKVSGKGLSTNDYTTTEKNKLSGIEAGAEVNEVNSVNSKQGVVVLNQDDIGDGATYKQVSQAEKNTWNNKQDELTAGDNITIVGNTISSSGGGEVDLSEIEQDILDLQNDKVDKVSGKGLSDENFTLLEKNKLDGIETGAEKNVAETDPIFTAWDKSTGISITKSQVSDLIEATQALSGLMSATDKQRLDVLHALLEEDTENSVVDSINEVLAIFNNYPEGADLVTALAGKVDKVEDKGLSENDLTNTLKSNYDTAYSWGDHAVEGYLKEITKVMVEGVLTGTITSHNHNGVYEPANSNIQNHISSTSNPHGVSKSQVGLGSVLNYGIASKTQAEDGTSNDLYMTPLRTKELITVVMGDIESALDAILGV